MSTYNISYRFSGHDTFHCKEQWLLKGLQLIVNQEDTDVFKDENSIYELGVGKNMVRSIFHWLKAFGLVNGESELSEIAKQLFIENELDPYLEYEGSLWLLQYYICKSQYASIFKIIFSDYLADKAVEEFSEFQIVKFIEKELRGQKQKSISEKTLEADYKVFIRSYVPPVKNHKTVEDDFNIPLLSLNLISDTKRKNDYGQSIYRINKGWHDIPLEIFLYCLYDEYESKLEGNTEALLTYDDIRNTLGAYLCLSNDKLYDLLEQAAQSVEGFVYKEDADVRQLRVKAYDADFKNQILSRYYELQ